MRILRIYYLLLAACITSCGIFSTGGPYYDALLYRHTTISNRRTDTIAVQYKPGIFYSDQKNDNFSDSLLYTILPAGSFTFNVSYKYPWADEDKTFNFSGDDFIDTISVFSNSTLDSVIIHMLDVDVISSLPGFKENGYKLYSLPNKSTIIDTVAVSQSAP